MGDEELERLKKRKLMELQRRLLRSQQPEKVEKPASAEEFLDRFFYGRAWEVYRAAKQQYPKVMVEVEKALLEAIKAGKIKERIGGEALYSLFNQLGMRVSLETKIRYKKHGELKTVGQKLKEKL